MTAERPLTGLVCTHERLTVGALFAASQLGLRVPAELSLISMDDREHAAELLIERLDRARAEDAQRFSFLCPVVEARRSRANRLRS